MSAARVDTAYSGTPLPKKLGMVTAKGGIGEVAVLGEPEGFRSLLGDLPAEITMQNTCDLQQSWPCVSFTRAPN